MQKDWKEKGLDDPKRALEYLERYEASSFLDYMDRSRIQGKIVDKKPFPDYFPEPHSFYEEIQGWMAFGEGLSGQKV